MNASVVICTFNRVDLLKDAIRAVQQQQFPRHTYEVIVVDNNSSDDTRAVTMRLSEGSDVPIRYVFEENQGLSFARNAGIRVAKGDIVAFVDDDIDAERNWLRSIVAPFGDRTVACVGGPVRPIWPFQKPDWLTKEWERYLGVSEFESVSDAGEFHWPDYPWGVNIAFRKDIFEKVGMFPTDLGRIGKRLLSNEEISVCRRIEAGGDRILLAPSAVIYHKIDRQRMTKQWFYHRAYYQGRSDAALDRTAAGNNYSRLRDFASSMFWAHGQKAGDSFDGRCRDRLFIGYLSQLVGIQRDERTSNDHRKLRALKTFLSRIVKTGAEVAAEANMHLRKVESLVHERDRWLADRDRQIADQDRQITREQGTTINAMRHDQELLETDRDNWQRVALEREKTLENYLAIIENFKRNQAPLETDRDNWQRLALEREQGLEQLLAIVETFKRNQAPLETDRDNWQRLALDREQALETQLAIVETFKRNQAPLEADRDNWQRLALELEEPLRKQMAVIADFQRNHALLETDRDNWQRLALDREQALETQLAIIETFKRNQAPLEADRDNWQRLALEREEALRKQLAVIENFQRNQSLLHTDRDNWMRLAREADARLTKSQEALWIRIGLRLGFLKNPLKSEET